MSRQYWISPIPPIHIADSTAYTGTAALGDISPAPAIVIPANTLEPGSRLEFKQSRTTALVKTYTSHKWNLDNIAHGYAGHLYKSY